MWISDKQWDGPFLKIRVAKEVAQQLSVKVKFIMTEIGYTLLVAFLAMQPKVMLFDEPTQHWIRNWWEKWWM